MIFHGFISILHEIQKSLLAQALIERNRRQSASVVALDSYRFTHFPIARKARSDNLQYAVEKSNQICRLWLRMQGTSEVQKFCDESAEPVDLG